VRATLSENPATGKERSIALETTDDAIAAETGGGIVTIEMVTGQKSAGGGQDRDQGIVITSARVHTDIGRGHAQRNTAEATDQKVTSVDARTIVTDHRETASMTAQEVRDEMRGVATAAGAAAGHRTSTQSRAEKALIELWRITQDDNIVV
jgi:hypothetical protein